LASATIKNKEEEKRKKRRKNGFRKLFSSLHGSSSRPLLNHPSDGRAEGAQRTRVRALQQSPNRSQSG